MATQIRTWQIIDGKLEQVDSSLEAQGRKEPYDLEPWIASNPEIIGEEHRELVQMVLSELQQNGGPNG